MRHKLFIFLIFGLLLTFAEEIKSEDIEICTYSKPYEFGSCKKKNNVKVIPNYPVNTFPDHSGFFLGTGPFKSLDWPIVKALELRAQNKDQIEISIGYKKRNHLIETNNKFISSKTFRINSKDIISWN